MCVYVKVYYKYIMCVCESIILCVYVKVYYVCACESIVLCVCIAYSRSLAIRFCVQSLSRLRYVWVDCITPWTVSR